MHVCKQIVLRYSLSHRSLSTCFWLGVTVQQRMSGSAKKRGAPAASKPSATSTVAPVDAAPAGQGALSFGFALALLLGVRVAGTLYYNMITDCDETFNYWEPTHYLLYGRGQQTWEYAPNYALRSYAYTGLHALIGYLVGGAFGADKIFVFHATRVVLAVVCGLGEAVFYRGVAKALGPRVGLYTLAGLALSAGMLHAAPAYLPSTFTMVGLLFSWGFWLLGHGAAAVAAAVLAMVLGWPFAIFVLAGMGLHLLITHRWVPLILSGVLSLALSLGVMCSIDHHFYGRWLIAPWNIIAYNALGQGGGGQGSELYGVEGPEFFAINLFLNFNALWVLAVLSPLAVAALSILPRTAAPTAADADADPSGKAKAATTLPAFWTSLAAVSPLWLWFVLMSVRPHKEERFMFVVFPLIPLAAAVTAVVAERLLAAAAAAMVGPRVASRVRQLLFFTLFAVVALISVSRIVGQVSAYAAPFAAWTAFARLTAAPAGVTAPAASKAAQPLSVCVGKEWYRFPASYFLPEHTVQGRGAPAELRYIKSGFSGLLPQPYLAVNGTAALRTGFNDENKEETDRYVPAVSCDYLVDLALPTPRGTQEGAVKGYEPHFAPGAIIATTATGAAEPESCPCVNGDAEGSTRWISVWEAPFLHADSTPSRARAFYVPGYTLQHAVYGTYHVLKRVDCCAFR